MDSVTYTRTADEIAQSRERWRHADAQYGENELRILGKAVMQGWEDPYMLELAKVGMLQHWKEHVMSTCDNLIIFCMCQLFQEEEEFSKWDLAWGLVLVT